MGDIQKNATLSLRYAEKRLTLLSQAIETAVQKSAPHDHTHRLCRFDWDTHQFFSKHREGSSPDGVPMLRFQCSVEVGLQRTTEHSNPFYSEFHHQHRHSPFYILSLWCSPPCKKPHTRLSDNVKASCFYLPQVAVRRWPIYCRSSNVLKKK